jgi:hypothetical protein
MLEDYSFARVHNSWLEISTGGRSMYGGKGLFVNERWNNDRRFKESKEILLKLQPNKQ